MDRQVPVWLSRLGKIALGGLAAGMILFLGTAVYALATLPSLSEGGLRPPVASVVYDMKGQAVGPLSGPEQRDPLRFEQMPKPLREAFVASEDVRFHQHRGVDPIGIARAAFRDLFTLSLQEGGSTITQQVVKNTLVGPRRTIVRKVQEMVLALQLERRYTKDEILNFYLNAIYLGDGAYGVGAAARTYFGHDLSHLTLGEAATLAGMTPAPERFDPFSHPDLARQRRNLVLDRMVAAGYLDPATAAAEMEKPLAVSASPPDRSRSHAWFMDLVRRDLTERFGLKDNEVDATGLRIYSTLDPRAQAAAEKVLGNDRAFPKDVPPGLEAAMAILDPKSGAVRAVVGGRRYTGSGGLLRAVDARRSPGSALKPVIVYGPALEARKLTASTLVEDTPLDVNGWQPQEFDGRWRGKVTVREALRLSLNVPAVRVLAQVGVPEARSFARNLGIALEPSDQSLTIALGGLSQGVSPLQVAAAYQAFANGGIYHEPHPVLRVVAADGEELTARPETHTAMRTETAAAITDMLQTVVRSGTGRGALLDRPMAGKTGTAELPDLPEYTGLAGNRDAWFAGYTPDLVGVVWMGYDRTDREHYLPPAVNGSTYPSQLWRQVMEQVLAGRPPVAFAGLPAAVPAEQKPPAPADPPADPPAPGSEAPEPAEPGPLPQIRDLAAAVDPRAGSVTLRWETVPAPAPGLRFLVLRGDNPDLAADAAHIVATAEGVAATDKPPAPGVYYYRVVAVDPQTGQTGPPSPAVKVTFQSGGTAPGTLPEIRKLKAAVDAVTGRVTLTWSTAGAARVSFRIFRARAETPDASGMIGSTVSPAYSDGPGPGNYLYRVAAFDQSTGSIGPLSDPVPVAVPAVADPPPA